MRIVEGEAREEMGRNEEERKGWGREGEERKGKGGSKIADSLWNNP